MPSRTRTRPRCRSCGSTDTTTRPTCWVTPSSRIATRGVYCYGYFNDTEQAKNAKTLVSSTRTSTALSIFANQLVEKAKQVSHGIIREVSLVLAGANPGALIDNIELQHADGEMVTIEDEAVIYTGETLLHGDEGRARARRLRRPPEDDRRRSDRPRRLRRHVGPSRRRSSTTWWGRPSRTTAAPRPRRHGNPLRHRSGDNEGARTRMTRNVFEQQNRETGGSGPRAHAVA